MNPNITMNDDLLVKYLLNEADAGEALRVRAWLDTSAENQKYFNDIKLIWEESLHLVDNNEDNESLAWNKLENRLNFNAPIAQDTKPIRFAPWMRIAASIVLICGLGWFAFNYFKSNSNPAMVNVQTTEQVLTQVLPDGSKVTLNKNSLISYSSKFIGNTRPVKLEGEAFFDVTTNANKPFVIKVNDITVKVLGTSFNIKSRNGKTQIVVETGAVSVSKQQGSIELQQGERISITPNQNGLSKESSTSKLYSYYRSNELNCDNTPLQELVDLLNEIHKANIIIATPTLQNMPITANFKNQPLDEVLRVIAGTFKIKVEHKNHQILLK